MAANENSSKATEGINERQWFLKEKGGDFGQGGKGDLCLRCQYKNCGGLIIEQKAFGPYPRRRYCHLCGREPIEESQDSDHPKGGQDMAEGLKTCRKCKVEKPLDEFGIRKSAPDGRNPMCLTCRKKYDEDLRVKQTSKTKSAPDQKPKTDKPKAPEKPPGKETIVQLEETADAQFVKAFKKDIIKAFIRNKLVPILERVIEDKFE